MMKSLLALGGIAADAASAVVHLTFFPAHGSVGPWALLCLSSVIPLAYGLTRSALRKNGEMPEVIAVESRRLVERRYS